MRKVSKSLVSLSVIVASTLLGSGLTGIASAAPVSVNMQQLDERVAKLPAMASLKDGDQVVISDNGAVTGETWEGLYVFHPAGSVVPVAPMYVRWKDGLVALTLTPRPTPVNGEPQPLPPGTLDANWVAQNKDINGNVIGNYQRIDTLVSDPGDPSVLRIPGNAWLFRVNSNGQYTTLVDAFVLVSGAQPVVTHIQPDLTILQVAQGSQPVPVSDTYWQPQ